MADETGVEAFARQQQAISVRRDQRDLLEFIECPTLILCGREDSLIPFPTAQALAKTIASNTFMSEHPECCEFVVLDGVGHMTTLEAAEQTNAALLRWMGR
jgi:pimeloyl-ACP methyl ester carboxylesterase